MRPRPSTICSLLLLPSAAWAGPNTLAVFYFDASGNQELAPLSVGLAQMLITDLHGTPGVEVVERAQLQALLDELELGHSGVADPAAALKLGKLLQARWIVFGSYFELAGTLTVQARLVETETTKLLHATYLSDRPQAFMEMEQELARFFREKLVVEVGNRDAAAPPGEPSKTRADGATGAAPTRSEGATAAATPVAAPDAEVLEAALAYSEGLIYLDKKDVARARESFQTATAKNPGLDAAKAELSKLEL